MNWNETNWELSNVGKTAVETSDLCSRSPTKTYQMFPERRSLAAGKELCVKVGEKVKLLLPDFHMYTQ